MKTKSSVLGALLFLLPFLGGSSASAVEWDLATNLPAGNFQVKNVERFAAEVKAATNADVVIQVHSGGALGFKGPDMLGAVRDGVVPIGTMMLSQQVGLAPILGTGSLAYLVSGFEEMKKFNDIARPTYDAVMEKYNQKILYITPWPGQNIFSKAEITSPDSFRTMKIRTLDRHSSDFFRGLGASPVQMPWGEVVPALATGVIDAVTTSSSSGVDGQFWEFMKACLIVNWQANFEIVSVNLTAWNKLKPESRAAIEATAKRLEGQFWEVARAEDAQKFSILESKGIKLVKPDQGLRQYMIAKAKPGWGEFARSVPQAKPLLDGYLAAVSK